jgi:penicillin-binding protein 1A
MSWNLVDGLLLLVFAFLATGAAMRVLPRPVLPARPPRSVPAPAPAPRLVVSAAAPAGEALPWNFGWAVPLAAATALLLGALTVVPCAGEGCDVGEAVRAVEAQTVYLDRGGVLLAHAGGHRHPAYDEMPPHLLHLAVAVEDRRFWEHPCVDPVGVARAAYSTYLRGRREGASTICMQAARALDREGRMPADGTWSGKLAETLAGVRLLVRTRSRKRVLALYLNSVYLGNSVYPGIGAHGEALEGVEAGAQYYFSKPASRLSLAEAATLVGSIQAPMRYHPVLNPRAARERRDRVLRMLAKQRPEYAARVDSALAEPLRTRVGRPGREQYLARRLDRYVPGGRGAVRTTLNNAVQASAEGEVGTLVRGVLLRGAGPMTANPVSAGVLVMRNDGELLAYACGRPVGKALAGWDPCGNGRIALASTLKVWLVAFALDRGVVREDERLSSISARHGRVHERGEFRRRQCPARALALTVREAFAESNNCLAIVLLAALPADARGDLARMGIPVDPASPATALGTQTLPIPVLLAYVAALTNGGRVPTPVLAAGAPVAAPPVDSLPLGAAAMATTRSLMRDVVSRGTARSARGRLAGLGGFAKTGTNENLDVRIVGGIDGGVVGLVWLGHPRPRPLLRELDAGRMLAPAWARILAVAARQP